MNIFWLVYTISGLGLFAFFVAVVLAERSSVKTGNRPNLRWRDLIFLSLLASTPILNTVVILIVVLMILWTETDNFVFKRKS